MSSLVNTTRIKQILLLSFFIPTTFVFAASSPQDSLSFRFYCAFASIIGDDFQKCFQKVDTNIITRDESSNTLRALEAKVASLEKKAQENSFLPKTIIQGIAAQPETVIKYVYVKGEKGDTGAQGPRGESGILQTVSAPSTVGALNAFASIPQPFWNGGGSSGGSFVTSIINQTSPLPTGGTVGQILTLDASSTPVWQTLVIPTTTPGWSLTGNSGTDSNVNFIGTTDNQDLVFKTNNATSGVIKSNGRQIFFGIGAGNGSSIPATDSAFFAGENAGNGATNAYNSNFLGYDAGNGAGNAFYSNFLGYRAGINASSASFSNFLGATAGGDANNASRSNFFGESAGRFATNASNSNFLGYRAGLFASDAQSSNFFGNNTGNNATNATNSNFFGTYAGSDATNASNSNFFGYYSGNSATNASSANFFGEEAGYNATNASNSNFFGLTAGYNATNASNSNFLGQNAGNQAINASRSIFIGLNAGQNDTVDNASGAFPAPLNKYSILFGNYINTGGFSNSVLIGSGVFGTPDTNTAANQFKIANRLTDFMIRGVNYQWPVAQGTVGSFLANDGNGNLTWNTVGASSTPTNGLSYYPAGIGLGGTSTQSTIINQTTFDFTTIRNLGIDKLFTLENRQRVVPLVPTFTSYNIDHAGAYAEKTYTSATNIGFGQSALGTGIFRAGLQRGVGEAGTPYFDAYNYIPISDGTIDVHRIYNSNYGPAMYYQKYTSGGVTTKRSYMQTRNDGGVYLTGSDESQITRADIDLLPTGNILLRSVNFPTSNMSATYNSSIGGGISLAHTSPGFSTTLTLSTTTGVTISNMLGVGVGTPLAAFHVATTTSAAVARFENSDGYCEIDPTNTALVCTSDESLKKDVAPLSTGLSGLLQLNPVLYRWNKESATTTLHQGFIAQQVESIFPDLVHTDNTTGLKSVAYTGMIPLLTQSIKDLNDALGDLTNESVTPESFTTSFIFKRILAGFEWMGVKIEKGIATFESLFAKDATIERLCFDKEKTVCLTKDEVTHLLQAAQVTPAPSPAPQIENQPATSTPVNEVEETTKDIVSEDATKDGSSTETAQESEPAASAEL